MSRSRLTFFAMNLKLLWSLAAVVVSATWFASPSLAAIAERDFSRWQPRIDRYLARDKTNPPSTGGVVFTGSSSIDMWRTLKTDFPDFEVVNRGIGGTWLAEVPKMAPLLVYPLKPRVVVIYAGENDLQDGHTVDQVVEAFEVTRDQVKAEAPGAPLIFLALKPSPSRRALLDKMREANRRIAELCVEDPLCTFVDVFTPMLDANGEPRGELFIEDRLHMNAEGYRIWTDLVGPALRKVAR